MQVLRNTEARTGNHRCCRKAITITYCEWVCTCVSVRARV